MMARVFVSYASEDRECAGQLRRWLVAEGHEVFVYQDLRDGILVGDDWDKRLHERLRWADVVVCVVSSAAVASPWCLAEVGIALSRGSRLVPVQAESGVNHPLLRSVQYADLSVDSTVGRAALIEALRRVDAVGGFGWPDDQSPFPGLRPFGIKQHRVFFGRSSETEELAELLRSPAEQAKAAVLLVVGPSGCGKSSLVRAGLLHVMADEPGWLSLPPILPGADPVAALARELGAAARRSDLEWTVDHVHRVLAERGLVGVVDELLVANPGGPLRRLLLVVDQWEELLTQTGAADRARFAQLLRSALSGPVQVVATLRPEFLGQLLVDSDLAVLPTRTYELRPLHREALRTVIEGPARVAGIDVAGDLVARLVADTESGEALPLLAFTLAELADGVRRGSRLSGARYDQLGGVQGALTRQANAALADAITASGRHREEIISGLLCLVTRDEQGRPTRWRVPMAQLPELVVRELDAFVTRRLISTDTDNGRVVVEVAHEAFLSAWPPLAQAIEENASALRARCAVEQAAAEWNDDGRLSVRLWERGQLAAVVADTGARVQSRNLVTDRVDLSPTARTFLRASIRRDRARRRRAVSVLSVLLVLALAATTVAVIQRRHAEQQRNVAVSQRVAAQALEIRATNPALAAQLSLAAYRLVPTPEARGSLLSTVANPDATRLTGHTSAVKGLAVSPDGHVLATGSDDMTVRLWDIGTPHYPRLLSTLTGHTHYVPSVAFSPDGHVLVTASDDRTVRLWDVRDPRQPSLLSTLTGHTNVVISGAFSPERHVLATGSYDGTARLWDIRDLHHPSPLSTLTGHTNIVTSVVFSPDGHILASSSYDTTARLWDLSRPIVTGHTNTVSSVTFNSDGHILVTASRDSTARLWDVHDPHQPHLLAILTATDDIDTVSFSPDGRTAATASDDSTTRLWDVHDPRQPILLATLAGHTGGVDSVAFSPNGNTIAIAGDDSATRLWGVHDPRQPMLLTTLTGHTGGVESVAFSPNGHILATSSADSTAQLWNVQDPRHPSLFGTLTGHTNVVSSVAFSPDGHTVATASHDTTVRLWNVHNPHHPELLSTLTGHDSSVNRVAFNPDGRTAATASSDNTVRLWDVGDLRRPNSLGTLTGHTSGVNSVAFSSDGHTLATASVDSTVRLWETNVETVATRICSLTPTITQNEWNQYLPSLPYRPPCP
jgi:WD40 repeat protein/energy-coupling factor transporter ATP-binding protein EcfA2